MAVAAAANMSMNGYTNNISSAVNNLPQVKIKKFIKNNFFYF